VQIGVVSRSKAIDATTLAFLVDAWDRQAKEIADAYGVPYTPVIFYDSVDELPVDTGEVRLFTIVDALPEAPDAEGYHDDQLGVIYIRILAENDAEAGPHEVCEEEADPTCDKWAPMGDGRDVAYEVCDPVEGDHYDQEAKIGEDTRTVPVSNYVLPSWFDPNGRAPYDRMGKLKAPLTMTPGGYMIVRDAAGRETDVFAQNRRVIPGGPLGRLRSERKRARPDSRLALRLAGIKQAR
jgi:hypothetical protein